MVKKKMCIIHLKVHPSINELDLNSGKITKALATQEKSGPLPLSFSKANQRKFRHANKIFSSLQ